MVGTLEGFGSGATEENLYFYRRSNAGLAQYLRLFPEERALIDSQVQR